MNAIPTQDLRPAVAIGHIGPILVSDVAASTGFYAAFGMRVVMQHARMSILELRGGTHLIFRQGMSTGLRASFDLMVDDIEEARRHAIERGLEPTAIRRGGVHGTFTLRDPDGRTVSVTSSHAMGAV